MIVPVTVDKGMSSVVAPLWSVGAMQKPCITVVGYRAFTQLMHSVVDEFSEQAQIRFVDHIFNVSGSDPGSQESLTGDVVVSAGANAGYLSASLAVPVLKLQVTETDILRSVLKAKRISSRIAVFIHGERSDFLDTLALELQLEIDQYSYLTPDEAAEKFLLASRAGLPVVVGSSLLCHLAEKRDIPAILIYSRSSCRALLRDAVAEGRALMQRRHFDALIAGLLEDPERPTVVTDAAGQILAVNKAMREGLYRSQRDQRRLADLIRLRFLDQAQDSIDVAHAEQDWVVTRSRVIVDADVLGYVFRFDRLQRSARSARPTPNPAFQFVSERIRAVLDLARLYASTDAAVLIQGESGCGKEVVARTIFEARPAPRGDFIAVNCSAIPDDLFESEMFGHVEGAFTGAKSGGKKGLFELANGGLIFLDEVGDLPLSQQAKLLRVLQQRSVRPVGGTVERQIHFKLVAATNVDLQAKVRRGDFRKDLFYRINVLSLTVPPLRERLEEVDAIAEQAIDAVRPRLSFSYGLRREGRALLQLLRSYPWPGNVRELESILQRVVTHLLVSDSPSALDAALPKIVPELFQHDDALRPVERSEDRGTLRARELRAIREAMERFNGDRTSVAKHLGISRATLWRRLQDLSHLP